MPAIDRALLDQRLLGAALGNPATWATWLVVLKAAFGLPLHEHEQQVFASVAGERRPPSKRVRELWAVAGRRGGKSRVAAALAVFLACFAEHRLSPGERGMVLALAASQPQARTVFEYVRGFLDASPALRREIVSSTRHEITLRNGIVIGVHSNSFRTVRGRTLLAAVLDEVSFWRDETSATPDIETYSAILPSLATTNGMLIGISTPYRKLGLLHQKYRDHFSQDGDDVLVVQGGSQTFNPSLTEAVITAQRAADPTAAASEWDAEFRADIAAFLDDALIDGAIEHARPLELPPLGSNFYKAFTDASGGRGDDYSLAIGHKDGELFVIDVIRGTHPPFDPHEVTKQYAALLKEYRIGDVIGDHYAAEWVARAWRDCGVSYIRSDINKSQIYLETLPLFARGVVRLPDHPRLLRELHLLERHTHRSGKDSIDHGRNGSDDHANACCGVLRALAAGAPVLWQRDAFLVDGLPMPMPAQCDGVFAVLVAGQRDAGVVFFAIGQNARGPLLVLDCEAAPLTPALFHAVAARLVELHKATKAWRGAFLFTTSVLAAEMQRLGYCVAEVIDEIASDDDSLLALAAALHIGAKRVTICSEALDKNQRHPLGFLDAATDADQTDPLRTAALVGIALALDTGRTLRARAA